MFLNFLKLVRAKHWVKNLLIFLPLLFSLQFTSHNITTAVIGFIMFCLTASIVYIINDIKDVKNDRQHPTKKNRPIASGYFSINNAIVIIVILSALLATSFVAFRIPLDALFIIITYIIVNIAYSCGLKNIPILDIFILAFGFVLRVVFGSAILKIAISNWLLLTVLCASLFMAIGKRRNELMQQKNNARPVNKFYNYNFLNSNLYTFMTLTICFYSLWTINSVTNHIPYAIYTVPLVVIILMTYSLKLDDSKCNGDPIDVLFKNRCLLSLCAIYILSIIFLIFL